jgi:hypothetical protein
MRRIAQSLTKSTACSNASNQDPRLVVRHRMQLDVDRGADPWRLHVRGPKREEIGGLLLTQRELRAVRGHELGVDEVVGSRPVAGHERREDPGPHDIGADQGGRLGDIDAIAASNGLALQLERGDPGSDPHRPVLLVKLDILHSMEVDDRALGHHEPHDARSVAASNPTDPVLLEETQEPRDLVSSAGQDDPGRHPGRGHGTRVVGVGECDRPVIRRPLVAHDGPDFPE